MPVFDCLSRSSRGVLLLTVCLLPATVRADDRAPTTFTQAVEVMPSQARGEPAPVAAASAVNWSAGAVPQWIWGVPGTGPCVVKTTFAGGAKSARLKATCDNVMKLSLNGQPIASSSEWQAPVEVDVLAKLKPGENELLAELDNEGGVSGFAFKLVLEMPDGSTQYVVSDANWKGAAKRDATEWKAVRIGGRMGDRPWGDIFSKAPELAGGVPRDVFEVLPGFQVERLFTVPKEELGSWVCITFDERGRLLVSDQGNKGICRVTPPGPNGETQVERLNLKISSAQGMLVAFGHLYFSINGGPGSGLYRAKYDAASDQYGEIEKLHAFQGGGEHGPHALRLSPDGKSIYVMAGNHTRPPVEPKLSSKPQTDGGVRADVLTATLPDGATSRILPNWDEDVLLRREWDARGHARGVLAPGGWIAKTDPEGKTWEVFSVGYRNAYDMAFNADGELFAYDSDMEWDLGMPWYRPTQLVHATSGSEFGWRSGTARWPAYFLDSLPPVIEIGPGSPVGVEFGYGTKFPAKYQRALYLCDWTFGTMYAVHLTPQGSTYAGVKEEFLSRTPLPLTDAAVGPDGAMYFTIGGRGTQSELFRVTYTGDESTAPADLTDSAFAAARDLRHQIEQLHGPFAQETFSDPEVVPVLKELVPAAESDDRFLQYASMLTTEWLAKYGFEHGTAVGEPGPDASLRQLAMTAVIGARAGTRELTAPLWPALLRVDLSGRNEQDLLDYLRGVSLLFIRQGPPDDDARQALIAKLDPLYPSDSVLLDRELVQMLVYLESPTIVEKAVARLARPTSTSGDVTIDPLLARNQGYGSTVAETLRSQPDVERIWVAFVLRNAKQGWTLDLKQQLYQFLSAAREWKGGASYQGFLSIIDNQIWEATPEKERIAIEGAGVRKPFQLPELPRPQGPGHDWTLEEVLARAGGPALERGRDFKNGERTYAAARCIVCHRFAGDGGATGPDLTQLAGRFNLKDLSEAILDPSKVISDQYKATTIVTESGQVYTGRVLDEGSETVSILIDPEDASKVVQVPRGEIEQMQPSAASLMPKDLLKTLNENEVLDLLAYLLSRGDASHAMFRKPR